MERGVRAYFTEKARTFDEIYSGSAHPFMALLNRTLRWDIRARMDRALVRLSREDIASVLDIGCGTGRLALELARVGKDTVGIDFSPRMIDIANAVKADTGIENAHFVCADFLEHEMGRRFDASVALGFFDYAKAPLDYLQRASSCTTRIMIATFPRAGTLRALLRSVRLGIFGVRVTFYSEAAVRGLLASAGFTVRELVALGQLFYVEAEKG